MFLVTQIEDLKDMYKWVNQNILYLHGETHVKDI